MLIGCTDHDDSEAKNRPTVSLSFDFLMIYFHIISQTSWRPVSVLLRTYTSRFSSMACDAASTDNDDSELQSQFTGSLSMELLIMWYCITVPDGQT